MSADAEQELDIRNLEDGVYSVSGNMVKVDKTTASMSDNAINHTVMLTVKDGVYYLTLDFQGLKIGSSYGYLKDLRYFLTDILQTPTAIPGQSGGCDSERISDG